MKICRKLSSAAKIIRPGQIVRLVCYFCAGLFCMEFILMNFFVFHIFRMVSKELSEVSSTDKSANLLDKLTNNRKISSLLFNAKTNGLFSSLLQETIERLYIVHETSQSNLTDKRGRQMKDISFIGLDVSHSGESTYIYSRILSRMSFPYHFQVVDIGTNDGFLSSNSFNFIQWGWDAVLIEPQATELAAAQKNIKRYMDRYNSGQQNVQFVQAAIGDNDGSVEFVITKATQGAESHVKSVASNMKTGDAVIYVPSITVKTLAIRYRIPKNFGILSIDAEGMGKEILQQWMNLEFRPAYIIFEHLHKREPLALTVEYLKKCGYKSLGIRGWNVIFEHNTTE